MMTAIAELLGFRLGSPLGRPAFDNPIGFFEHLRISEHHERLLAEVDLRWRDADDPFDRADPAQLRRWSDETSTLLAEVSEGLQPFCFKDPRTVRFLPTWHDAFKRADWNVQHLVVVRDPRHVGESLRRRNGLKPLESDQLWLFDYGMLAIRLADLPYELAVYRQTLNDPSLIVDALLRLGANPTSVDLDTIRAFVDRELDHGCSNCGEAPEDSTITQRWYRTMCSTRRLPDRHEALAVLADLADQRRTV